MVLDTVTLKCLRIVLVVAMTAQLTSCRNDYLETFFAADDDSPSGYHTSTKTFEGQGALVTLKTRTDLQKGVLVLMMNVKNNSSRSIIVDYMNCVLNLDEGHVVVPRVLRFYKSTIPYDDEESYEIYFDPINSIEFYDNTGYRGDMKQQYRLDLNFIVDGNGQKLVNERVVFSLADSSYQNYLNHYAREKSMQVFSFNFNSNTFDLQEGQHLHKIFSDRASVKRDQEEASAAIYSISPAITINRMIFNVFSYKEKDTLVVNMRMLHEDLHPLKIIPSGCTVSISGMMFHPSDYFSDTFDEGKLLDSTYIFKPGTRLHLQLKYFVPQKLDSWELSNDWLMVNTDSNGKIWRKLLFDDIQFRESVTTRHPLPK
jgi:hypothetical protein